MNYLFDGQVSYEVLCSYLNRAVTISLERSYVPTGDCFPIKSFILTTRAKYICRAATCWQPSISDLKTHSGQREFLKAIHVHDPQVVFEACIFECVSKEVNEIPIESRVLSEFGQPAVKRCFSYDAMLFPDGQFVDHWGKDMSVPDITRPETMMFFYQRALTYIDLGYEALHMGQVHLIGATDEQFACFTELLSRIRAYASRHARRHFVFINAHTHGMIGSDGKLLFDFHMYPSRPHAPDHETKRRSPSGRNPQTAQFSVGHLDSIYGKSLGGITPSGWSCDSLPYLVELDNYGNDEEHLFVPDCSDMRCWGMDEISWFANQPYTYRAKFLRYAYNWIKDIAPGRGFLAMPGQRVATIYDGVGKPYAWQYFAYNATKHPDGFNDEKTIREIWEEDSNNEKLV